MTFPFPKFIFLFLLLASHLSASSLKTQQAELIQAARWQIGKTISYQPSYQAIAYPNGDIPLKEGVCTDVIIRAFRKGLSMDLQKMVHLDMKKSFSKYPKIWGLKHPDKNIDHRRVPNLRKFFTRKGWSKPVTKNKLDYLPGDIVTCTVAGRLPHIMIVSDKKTAKGIPMIIHNIGSGTIEADCLFNYPITAHFRVK